MMGLWAWAIEGQERYKIEASFISTNTGSKIHVYIIQKSEWELEIIDWSPPESSLEWECEAEVTSI